MSDHKTINRIQRREVLETLDILVGCSFTPKIEAVKRVDAINPKALPFSFYVATCSRRDTCPRCRNN